MGMGKPCPSSLSLSLSLSLPQSPLPSPFSFPTSAPQLPPTHEVVVERPLSPTVSRQSSVPASGRRRWQAAGGDSGTERGAEKR